ncbi:TPR repeat family protein [Leishmania donovani]|uniref:TPR repeat family protein n=1 Tax=Leishmania donovani TaxID=5661 RepID=A0A504XZJ8_LEIDO|nr:TPR repeat family protein [Leishmania donovani]
MEWPSPSSLPGVEGSPGHGRLCSATSGGVGAFQQFSPATAATVGDNAPVPAEDRSPVSITVGEAMDAVAVQCERRGLINAATWLSEMSLHALPSLLTAPLQACSYGGHGGNSLCSPLHSVIHLDSGVFGNHAIAGDARAAPSAGWQRLHRVALGYFIKGEYQRCHHLILREVMRNTAVSSSCGVPLPSTTQRTWPMSVGEVSDNEGGLSLPLPEVVRGFRTTTLPPLLQFLSLYALFMDGVKAKQLSNNASQGGGAESSGMGRSGQQRALHPHARVLRAYLLEAMRNPVNMLNLPSSGNSDPEPQHGDGVDDEAALHAALGGALPSAHHTSSAKRPWTTSSAVWLASRAVSAATTTGIAAVMTTGASASRSAATKQAGCTHDSVFPCTAASPVFSNVSPAGSPAAKATAVQGGESDAAPTSDLLHIDPYLSWLMGVVLRELRMRQESATFLLAAVSVNPLLRCAWEDLACLVSREAQLAELDAALDGLEPFFMVDIFAAEVRGLLGITPVSSARLRIAAAAASAPSDGFAHQLAHFYYHQRNRLDRAEALYQRIRALDPHYLAILYDYSNVLYTKRDRLGLSSLAQSVYQADAFRAETNFAVGNYYVLLGQHDRAALHFHRATAIDPQCAEAWLLLGHAYVEVKNTTAAVEAYRTAVELNERDYRGWYNLGQIYELLEAYHHALYYYWHTTSLRPADPGMWVAVANCLEHDGRIAESIACLERAETYDSSSSPSYPAYVRRIATHHIANSSYTRACVYLEKLAQSPAASTEDLLLALPFIVQHYVQRARSSVEGFVRSSSHDTVLFSPGANNVSLMSSPASGAVAAGRTALHHARAAAALQHLNKAEEHLSTMAELVMPSGRNGAGNEEAAQTPAASAAAGESEQAGAENSAPQRAAEDASNRRRTRQPRSGPAANASVSASTSAALAAVAATTAQSAGDMPPVAFVRSRHQEICMLRAQAMHLLQIGAGAGSSTLPAAASASASAATQPSSSSSQQQQHRNPLVSQLLGRNQ